MGVHKSGAGIHGYFTGVGNGVAIDAAANGGKGQGSDPVVSRQRQAVGITTGQQAAIFGPAPVYRPHAVNHISGRQSIALG